ncbi:MAG: NADH:ubiquinone reductase (Na(+)-transporting) subunit D [Deltaproteobacteria bacterium]|nr:NADH:ubiquinone reductase (Na(+)-transporting) subunit D [Deltaproteobacteria bacterium]
MKITKTKAFNVFFKPIWESNPISGQILGICSALAVTVQLKTAVVMGLALTLVLAFSNLSISLMRKFIPRNIRIKAFLYDISKQLSIFVGLIITNCIILGRAETYALGNPPFLSLLDGIGNGLGYSQILITVAVIREFFGAGKFFGFQVIPDTFYAAGYENMGLMVLAPGAFIAIGLIVWLQNTVSKE